MRNGKSSGNSIEVIIPSSVIAGSGSMYSQIERLPEREIEKNKEVSSIEVDDSELEQASEEDVLKNLKECMESKGFLFNYRHSPREELPSVDRSARMDKRHQNEEDLLERLAELTGLLKLIRKRGDGALDSIIVSRSRVESGEWEADREIDPYDRVNLESRGINSRSSLEIVESIMRGLRNAEPDLNR